MHLRVDLNVGYFEDLRQRKMKDKDEERVRTEKKKKKGRQGVERGQVSRRRSVSD